MKLKIVLNCASHMENIPAHKEKLAVGKPIILLDVDNTLVSGFTVFSFAKFLEQKGLIKPDTTQVLNADLQSYSTGDFNYQEFATQVVSDCCEALKDTPQDEIAKAGEEFLPIYLEHLLPFATELVRIMNSCGVTIAISGAPKEAFEPLAKHLGIAHSYLLEAEVASGVYTGKVKTNMALGDEKIRVIERLKTQGFEIGKSFAFGDSSSDLPLLEAVSNPFTVNPNEELRTIAVQREWPIVNSGNIIQKVQQRIQDLGAK